MHLVRNLLALVHRTHHHMVAAVLRTVFAQPDPGAERDTWDEVAAQLRARFPKVAALMADAKPELLAFAAFPRAHWQKIWPINLLERINKEIKRLEHVGFGFTNFANYRVRALINADKPYSTPSLPLESEEPDKLSRLAAFESNSHDGRTVLEYMAAKFINGTERHGTLGNEGGRGGLSRNDEGPAGPASVIVLDVELLGNTRCTSSHIFRLAESLVYIPS